MTSVATINNFETQR